MTSAPELIAKASETIAEKKGRLARIWEIKDKLTYQVKGKNTDELIQNLATRFSLKPAHTAHLEDLAKTKEGRAFLMERVHGINRESFHRSAFLFNAASQIAFVDLAGTMLPFLPTLPLKLIFAAANLGIAAYAHRHVRRELRSLLAGPEALPPKRKWWGLLSNGAYNRAVKKQSKKHGKEAWREKIIYRGGYYLNAASLFLGGQFLVSSDKLIWPVSYIFAKAGTLVTLPLVGLNIWRGTVSGSNALRAREQQNSTLGKLQI
ncbi:MAG: hypothetical protein EBQ96_06965 [Proteobacteria bacterium]|nr:hypothetical protein [Pseudomonadota bacterium]